MIKKIIEISKARTRLSVKYGQLIIEQDEQKSAVPCEDIGILLVDHSGVVYTHCVFTELLQNNAAVVLCSRDHHPTGMLLPIESNSIQTEKYRDQIGAPVTLKKQIWQQIIKAKIKHQAKLIKQNEIEYKYLLAMAKKVKSGDSNNMEAQASKRFWGAFFPFNNFHRLRYGEYPNNLLNYGYMVMRAAVARAICCGGLLPSLGLHHCNRYNAFCLADDLMEPFRGFVEAKVREICENNDNTENLDQFLKGRLLEVLYDEVEIANYKGPLMVGLHRTVASLSKCFQGEQKTIDLPVV